MFTKFAEQFLIRHGCHFSRWTKRRQPERVRLVGSDHGQDLNLRPSGYEAYKSYLTYINCADARLQIPSQTI